MTYTPRRRAALKSTVYALLCLLLLLFSASFFPALGVRADPPCLLIAAFSLLACFETVGYPLVLSLLFGVFEAYMLAENILLIPLFYLLFAAGSRAVLHRTAEKRFWLWLPTVPCGLLLRALLLLVREVAAWNVPVTRLIGGRTAAGWLLSILLSLPLYPLFSHIARKTDL